MDIITQPQIIQGIPVIACCQPDTAQQRPLVFLIHGFSGQKEHMLAPAKRLAQAGYLAVSVDAYLHGEWGEQPFKAARVTPRIIEVTLETARGVARLIDHYRGDPRAAADQVGLVGASMGGAIFYAYQTLNNPPPLSAAVTMITGAPGIIHKTFCNAQIHHPEFGVTPQLLHTLAAFDQAYPFDCVPEVPLLMLYGEADPLVPLQAARRLYEQIRPLYADPAHIELITYPNCGHKTPPEMYAQAVRWLQTHL